MLLLEAHSAGLQDRVSAALGAGTRAANGFKVSPRTGAGQAPNTKQGLRV
jgi:hypothetical protein